MAQHIMLDLETLSTAGDAGIIQIGAQLFDPQGEDGAVLIGDGICLNVDPQAVMNAGMRVDWDTLHWWMSQPAAFATLAAPGQGLLLSDALKQLSGFVNANGGSWAKVWSNGAAFDVPVLETSYRRCRLDIPWKYNNVLDVRTMKWLAPGVAKVEPELAHNALSDCRAQALYVAGCYRAIKGMGAAAREEDKPQPPVAATETIVEAGGEDKTAKLGELWDRLQRLDWWHMMSDDPGVHRRGETDVSEARRVAYSLGQEGQDLFRAVEDHVKRGGPEVPRPGA